MPVYEYCCSCCGLKFELRRSMSEVNEGASCPRCNNEAGKVISNFAAFSKNFNGTLSRVGGGNQCEGCSADDCSNCS